MPHTPTPRLQTSFSYTPRLCISQPSVRNPLNALPTAPLSIAHPHHFIRSSPSRPAICHAPKAQTSRNAHKPVMRMGLYHHNGTSTPPGTQEKNERTTRFPTSTRGTYSAAGKRHTPLRVNIMTSGNIMTKIFICQVNDTTNDTNKRIKWAVVTCGTFICLGH